jgi:type I restriction enzyme S subunit
MNRDETLKCVSESVAGTSHKRISRRNLENVGLHIPALPEQTQIGTYFQNLDTLISLHQRKYDKLLTVKKAMLEKMFPKEGADVPEIRFKGFEGKWEKKNWKDTVDISTNMVDPKTGNFDDLNHIGPGNIESFTGRIYDNVLSVKDSNLISGKFHFKKGDIIYGKINPQLAKYTIAPFDGLASADSYILHTKNNIIESYLYVILQTKAFYDYSVSVSARTGMPKINRDELNAYNYLAPYKEEQTKIGTFFQNLDTLIKQHQKELVKLKNLKKACLEKMFV